MYEISAQLILKTKRPKKLRYEEAPKALKPKHSRLERCPTPEKHIMRGFSSELTPKSGNLVSNLLKTFLNAPLSLLDQEHPIFVAIWSLIF